MAEPAPILLFDGDCAFCNGCVLWLLRHERAPNYRFAPLQSAVAAPLLDRHGIDANDLSSIVVIDADRVHRKSAAVLHLLRATRQPWRSLAVLSILPRRLRDAAYDYVGARRYGWWGRATSCVIADPAWRSRVLAAE